MPLKLLPVLFLLMPLIEIGVFISVGQWIGLWQTIGLVVLSSLIGVFTLRVAGVASIQRINRDLRQGLAPEGGIAHSIFIALGGLLLIIPGFVTDLCGLLLLLPPVRAFLKSRLKRHVVVRTGFSQSASRPNAYRDGQDDFVDLSPDDYSRTDDEDDSEDRRRLPHRD